MTAKKTNKPIHNITLIRNDNELEQNLAELIQITDSIPLLIARLNPQHQYLLVNQAYADWFGLEKETFLGMRLSEVIGELPYKDALPNITKVLAGQKVSYEGILENRDKQPRVVMITFVPQLDKAGDVRAYISVVQDTTDRKQTEIALQIREAHYRGIVEDQTELIFRYLPDGTVTFANQPYCRYFGVKFQDIMGEKFTPASIPVEDVERIRSLRRQISPHMPTISYEFPVLIPGGNLSWVLWNEHGIFIDNTLVEYQAVGRDITSRKQAERALRQSEERQRMVISNLPLIVFTVDLEGRLTFSEGKGLDLLGLRSREDALGSPATELFGEIPELSNSIRRSLEGESFRKIIDASNRVFEAWFSPLNDQRGNIQGMIGVAIDDTERKMAESKLRESEERYRELVENQGEGALILDALYRFEFLNLAAEAIFGASASEIVGRSFFEFAPKNQKKILKKQFELRSKGKSSSYELTILRPDEEKRHLLITATPRFNPEGQFLGSFTICRDISKRIQVEEKLRFQSNHDALTGLYNRRYFEEEIHRLEHSRRFPMSIILTDVDDLKAVNDTLGHLDGDEHLRRIGVVLQQSFRAEDMIARLSGDEFVVLLPNTDKTGLDKSIQRLKGNLEKASDTNPGKPRLNISIGGATSETRQPLLKAYNLADQRMYREKRKKKTGRA